MNEKEIKGNIDAHIEAISNEFRTGFEFIKQHPKSVTIFGSSRLTDKSSHYNDVRKLAERIVKETGYSIVTGGGPGIMEAANRGAHEAGGNSIGLNIKLPTEQRFNEFTTHSMLFHYFFARKAMLAYAAEAYVFFPGGYGTFDELFGILTLLQTKKIPPVPVILFGKDFWNPLKDFIQKNMLDQHHTIEPADFKLFVITDSVDQTVKAIKDAPVSEWWKLFD